MNSIYLESLESVRSAIAETGLPVRIDELEDASSRVLEYMVSEGYEEQECSERFSELWEIWLSTGEASKEFKSIVFHLFKACPRVEFLGEHLFSLHDDLVGKDYLTHEQAMALIGSAERIVTLALHEKMCAYMITEHIGIEGLTFHSVQRMLRCIGLCPEFTKDDAVKVMKDDRAEVLRTFKDDDDDQALETLGNQLGKLDCPDSIVSTIKYLDRDVDHEPYMFMIHFELLPLEKYDRYPGKGVYEFSPRGEACNYLWHDEYRNPTQNPYLNNAKGFAALDMTWAENRKGKQGAKNGPVRLVELFAELGKLPYPSRRHAGCLIRRWLCRRLDRIQESKPEKLPLPAEKSRIRFLKQVSKGNTASLGVIDQRVCDFLAVLDQPEQLRKKARGLGSSVNETNLSAAKIGDVEFVDYGSHSIVGYEAHGGQLRDEYVDLHLNTLDRILSEKRLELREEADPAVWDITVKFVAHDISPLDKYATPTVVKVSDYDVTVLAITYSGLMDSLGGIEGLAEYEELFDSLIHEKVNYGAVPEPISKRYYELISL